MLAGRVGEEDKADAEAGDGQDEEDQRRAFDPDEYPPRYAMARRSTK